MPTVLHVVSQLEEGGTQRQLAYIAQFHKRYDVEIASLIASPEEKLFAYFRKSGVPVHFLSHSSDFYAPEIMDRLKHLLHSKRFALIHCRLYSAIVQGMLVARQEKIPVVASPGNMLSGLDLERNKGWEKMLIRKMLRSADALMFPSRSSAVDFVEAGWADPSRVYVISNGVDAQYFSPQNEAGETLVAIGRISEQKAYEDLHAIVQIVRSKFLSLRCVVAGGGGTIPAQDGIEYAGYVPDVRELLKHAAVFISTSKAEGMSNSLLEAQAMGIPVVARNIGPNSEIIEHGYNGFLAETKEEFAAFCERLLSDSELRKKIGKNARSKIEKHFSIHGQIDQLERMYDELLGL